MEQKPVQLAGMVRSTTRLAWVGVLLVTLVLAHELVFLVGYGSTFGDVLARTGHDARWSRAVAAVLLLGAVLLLASAWRIYRLTAQARTLGVQNRPGSMPGGAFHARSLAGHVLRDWLALSVSTAALFVLQENIERVGVGQPPPGVTVLASAEYPHALLVIAAVAFAAALVAALFHWRRDVLMARIHTASSTGPRRQAGRLPGNYLDPAPRPGSVLGRRQALRAPPGAFAT